MSKQIVLRIALVSVAALMIGLAGCNAGNPAANTPPPPQGTVPKSIADQLSHLPPDQQAQILKNNPDSPQAKAIRERQNGSAQSGSAGK
jgi:hypothetical protein